MKNFYTEVVRVRSYEVDLAADPARPAELVPPKDAALEPAFTVGRSDVDLAAHANTTGFVE